MYINAKYINGLDGTPTAINAETGDNRFISVPLDPANTDYQNIMRLVDDGELVIAPAAPQEGV